MHPQGLLRIIARILTPTLTRALMAATVLPHARLMAAIGKQVDISKECGDRVQFRKTKSSRMYLTIHKSSFMILRSRNYERNSSSFSASMMRMAVLEFQNAIKSYSADSCAAQQLINIFIFQNKIFFIRTNRSWFNQLQRHRRSSTQHCENHSLI